MTLFRHPNYPCRADYHAPTQHKRFGPSHMISVPYLIVFKRKFDTTSHKKTEATNCSPILYCTNPSRGDFNPWFEDFNLRPGTLWASLTYHILLISGQLALQQGRFNLYYHAQVDLCWVLLTFVPQIPHPLMISLTIHLVAGRSSIPIKGLLRYLIRGDTNINHQTCS